MILPVRRAAASTSDDGIACANSNRWQLKG